MSLRIVEGVSGVWFYHLRDDDQRELHLKPALCGKQVMGTKTPLSYWGKTPANHHIPEKWCKVCPRVAIEKGLAQMVGDTLTEVKNAT